METNKQKIVKPKVFKGVPMLTSEDFRVVLLEAIKTFLQCWIYYWAFLYGTKIVLGIFVKNI
jgi:hypothetical protein